MEDPESSSINGKDMYDTYLESIKVSACESKPVTKSQFSMIISRVFKNVHISTVHGYRVYKGIKKYDFDNENSDPIYIQNVAEQQGFFRMNSKDSLKFAISSGHCISHADICKIIEINSDSSWKLFISEHEVDPKIIGLQNITCNTCSNVKTLFNTVKQASICRGKPAKKDQRSSKYRIIQEWNICGQERIECRISSRKCQHFLSFMALSDVCPVCSSSRDSIESGSKESISDEEMFQQLFPGASEQMLNHFREQSKRCKLKKDPRANRWERDTISLALSLWNRSPQVTSCFLISDRL